MRVGRKQGRARQEHRQRQSLAFPLCIVKRGATRKKTKRMAEGKESGKEEERGESNQQTTKREM